MFPRGIRLASNVCIKTLDMTVLSATHLEHGACNTVDKAVSTTAIGGADAGTDIQHTRYSSTIRQNHRRDEGIQVNGWPLNHGLDHCVAVRATIPIASVGLMWLHATKAEKHNA